MQADDGGAPMVGDDDNFTVSHFGVMMTEEREIASLLVDGRLGVRKSQASSGDKVEPL